MSEYISVAKLNFNTYKTLADKAISSLTEEEIHFKLETNENSVAIIMQHLIGNARSRFTDFFNSDGEKENRKRDSEFIEKELSKEELIIEWNYAWKIVFDLLESMSEEDLNKIVSIRSEKQTVLKAINRQVAHYAYHVGQIVFLAKHLKGNNWQTLSIAKGKSEEYNKGIIAN
jgi:hypothetical protein